jgi:hypothetical protein
VDAYGNWAANAVLIDFDSQIMFKIDAFSSGGTVSEYDLWGDHTQPLWTESGPWTVTAIPEPSCGALFSLATVVVVLWHMKRNRAQND